MRSRDQLVYIALAAGLLLSPLSGRAAEATPVMTTHERLVRLNQALAKASESGDIVRLLNLVRHGANPNHRDAKAFQTPLLLRALISGQTTAVTALLSEGAVANARDARGTPLIVAAASMVHPGSKTEANQIAAIQTLIDFGGADTNFKDQAYIGDDRTALHMAAANGSTALMRLLLTRGANPHLKNRFGETPLFFAAKNGNLKATELLLFAQSNPNQRSFHSGETALMAASQMGHVEIVKLLLKWGSVTDLRNAFGKSAADLAKENYTRETGLRKPASRDYGKKNRYLEILKSLARLRPHEVTSGQRA